MSIEPNLHQSGRVKWLRRVLLTLAVLIVIGLILQIGQQQLSAIETVASVSTDEGAFPFFSQLVFVFGAFLRLSPEFGIAALCAFAAHSLKTKNPDMMER